jgi:hypothetical protein
MTLRKIICSVVMLAASDAMAWTYHLQSDLGLQGQFRYCEYDNGESYTVNPAELCPLTVEDTPPGMAIAAEGFLVGEYMDGMSKVCVYEAMGAEKALRFSSTSICPLSTSF